MKEPIVFIDADSVAAAAGVVEHPDQVRFVVDSKLKSIREACQCSVMKGYVEAWDWKQNYRKHVSCTRIYKGSRGEKPRWMTEAKKYMVNQYGFEICRWYESEDAVASEMHEYGLANCFGAAIDKDVVKGCPGRWWNYNKNEWTVTDYSQAERFMYYQVLVGDSSVDNIPGLPKVGAKTAQPIIDACSSIEELPIAVAKAYKSRGHPYAYLLEQSRLIRIRRAWNEDPFTPITRQQWEAIECDSKTKEQ